MNECISLSLYLYMYACTCMCVLGSSVCLCGGGQASMHVCMHACMSFSLSLSPPPRSLCTNTSHFDMTKFLRSCSHQCVTHTKKVACARACVCERARVCTTLKSSTRHGKWWGMRSGLKALASGDALRSCRSCSARKAFPTGDRCSPSDRQLCAHACTRRCRHHRNRHTHLHTLSTTHRHRHTRVHAKVQASQARIHARVCTIKC